jgi:hypothetical protein
MSHELVWLIVVIAAIVILAIVVIGFVVRSRRKPFETRPVPGELLSAYETRIPEIEMMFVNQPREALAAAKMLVDDMYTRMGYPARMHPSERIRDIRAFNREHARRYSLAARIKENASTEEMRRALQAQLDIARSIIGEGRKSYTTPTPDERTGRELAG